MKCDLPYVDGFQDRHKRWRYYFRRRGKRIALPGAPGSQEFVAAYNAALSGPPPPRATTFTAGSFDALREAYLRSAEFQNLRPTTQREARYALDAVCLRPNKSGEGKIGDNPVAKLERRHILEWRDSMAKKPGAAAGASLGLSRDGGGQKKLNIKKRHFALTQWKSLMHNAPRLRDVMRMYTLPLPLRQIRAGALAPSHWPVIVKLSKIPTSALAQAIPPKYQSQWIKALSCWAGTMQNRANIRPGKTCEIPHFGWCAAHWCDDPEVRKGRAWPAGDMADFARTPQFNPVWTWQQAVAAQIRWHEQLTKAKYGDVKVDASPFPDEVSISGYDFVALRTPLDLWAEGQALHHCVGSYADELVKGMCRLISLRQDGKRVATAEFRMHMPSTYHPVIEAADTPHKSERGGWRLRQFKALLNAEPPPAARQALKDYSRHVSDSQKLDKR